MIKNNGRYIDNVRVLKQCTSRDKLTQCRTEQHHCVHAQMPFSLLSSALLSLSFSAPEMLFRAFARCRLSRHAISLHRAAC